MQSALKEFASTEGHFLSPEGAAVWHAAKSLRKSGWIQEEDQVLLLNTGSGYKYAENLWQQEKKSGLMFFDETRYLVINWISS